MLKIKTIKNRLDNSEDFDASVNAAIEKGWVLKKRDVIPSRSENRYTMLYAELERRIEDEKLAPASWLHSRRPDGYVNAKCSACHAVVVTSGNILPFKCANCNRPMEQREVPE